MEIRKANLLINRRTMLAVTACTLMVNPAHARSSAEHRARKPHYFHSETGYRIERYRAPAPDDVPGATRISAMEMRALMTKGAVAIDVLGVANPRFDEFDGSWIIAEQRMSIPGAVWLPEVGRGAPFHDILDYLDENLARLTGGDKHHLLIFFCIADCWMSWNTTQRATALGYTNAHWFAEGTDGWLDEGWELEPVDPVPVTVE